jgi:hypothetical protein
MGGHDLVRPVEQEAGRPEVVGQVVATPFQLGREPAVEQQEVVAGCEQILHAG